MTLYLHFVVLRDNNSYSQFQYIKDTCKCHSAKWENILLWIIMIVTMGKLLLMQTPATRSITEACYHSDLHYVLINSIAHN